MKSIILFAILTGISALFFINGHGDIGMIVMGCIVACFALWMLCCILASVWAHMEDLEKLYASTGIIEAAEARLASTRGLLADETGHGLPEHLLALDQDSSPITTHMTKVERAIQTLEDAYVAKAKAAARIASRAVGPFSIVVTIFGKTI